MPETRMQAWMQQGKQRQAMAWMSWPCHSSFYSYCRHLPIGQEWLVLAVLAYQPNPHEGICNQLPYHIYLASKICKSSCPSPLVWEIPNDQWSDLGSCLAYDFCHVAWGFHAYKYSCLCYVTAPFVPCHTIPLGDEACLAPRLRGAEGRLAPDRPLATRSRLASNLSRSRWRRTAETRKL